MTIKYKGNSKYLPLIILLIEAILYINSYLTAGYVVFEGVFPNPKFYALFASVGFVIWIVIAIYLKLYDLPRILYTDRILKKNSYGLLIFLVSSLSLLYLLSEHTVPSKFIVFFFLFYALGQTLWKLMFVVMFKSYRRKGKNFRTVVMLGNSKNLDKFSKKILERPENGYIILGYFHNEEKNIGDSPYYKGNLEDFEEFIRHQQVDELVISLNKKHSAFLNKTIRYAEKNMMRVQLIPQFSSYLYQNFTISYEQNIPVLEIFREPLESLSNRIAKRLFDIVFSLIVLLLIGSWLFPIIAILIKLTSKGPVFFSQLRSGKDDVPFHCLKFRSMTVNKDSDKVQAVKGDKRITKIGRIIRKTSIDEFPQFFNVLMSHMSVVGPRPHMIKHTHEYQKLIQKFMIRHYAKPGITGLAQIRGHRGETKKVSDMEKRVESDIVYIENWSLWLDMKIVFLTAWQIIFKNDEVF